MNKLKGKKLLIIGANPETTPLVEVANEMGIKTYVTSNRPNDAAKKAAYKACDVDGMDVDALVSLCKQEEIDGVLVGVADALVPAYCRLCERRGLPCYASQKIVDVFSYKDVFKKTFEEYGIHGIPEYQLDEKLNPDDVKKIKFPVMVKPVDSSSGMGMTVCYKADELKSAVEKALDASHVKRFIVEKYMQCDDMGIYYTFKDGYCSASCVYDRYTSNEQTGLSRVCVGGTYPSKHLKEYFSNFHDNAVKLFKGIGIRNGVLMLSAFYENGEFYVYDTGFRLQGEAPHLLMRAIHGFDQREMLIRFALTGSEGEIDLAKEDDTKLRGKWAATLWFLLREGTIAEIRGMENIERDKRLIANIQRFSLDDVVLPEWIGTEKQVFTRLYFVCDSKVELADALKEYRNKIQVIDKNGESMLLNGFDVDKALELV